MVSPHDLVFLGFEKKKKNEFSIESNPLGNQANSSVILT